MKMILEIFETIQKILWMGTGYAMGFMIGIIIGLTGLYTFFHMDNTLVLIMICMITFIGCLSLFILLRSDTKIEGIKEYGKETNTKGN